MRGCAIILTCSLVRTCDQKSSHARGRFWNPMRVTKYCIIPQIQVAQLKSYEHEIYRQITTFIVVFDAAGDWSRI